MREYKRTYPPPVIGKQYGDLIVTAIKYGPLHGIKSVKCRCTCGRVVTPHPWDLAYGKSTHCPLCKGRVAAERLAASRARWMFIPDAHRRRIRGCVYNAISRCDNKKCWCFARYGGRGITIYPAWREDRTLFARYLLTLLGWDNPNLTIDRIDNNGNYEPGNLRWITVAENNRNR